MTSDQLTADILKTRAGAYTVFVGVVRRSEGGEIVWRSEQPRNRQMRAWEDAERGFAMMERGAKPVAKKGKESRSEPFEHAGIPWPTAWLTLGGPE